MSDPIVGILGGMGPEATVDLMRRVIAATPATDDIDHIHMIVDNNPQVPSRIAALIDGTGESPAPVLTDMARGLERSGAQILAMPCNTAHMYVSDIRSAVTIPMLDMVELTAQHLSAMEPRPAHVGILASSAVVKTGLYTDALAVHAITPVTPQRQNELMDIIMAVKRADVTAATEQSFQSITNELVAHGAEVLVLACTEFSVLAPGLGADVPIIDALDVLTDAIVDFGLA